MFTNINGKKNFSQEEHKSGIYKKEIERSTEMTKESANRAVEKAEIARTAAQEISGTGPEAARQVACAAIKALDAAKQSIETAELSIKVIEDMGKQQKLTQPVLDPEVKEKATKQNSETGELIKCVMEGIEELQKVIKRVLNIQANEKTTPTPSIKVEDVGKTGTTVEDAEKAVYLYRDIKSES